MTLLLAFLGMALVAGAALGAGWLAGEIFARRGVDGAGAVWGAIGVAGIVLLAGSWLVAPVLTVLLGGAVAGRLVIGLFLTVILAFAVVPATAALVARRVTRRRGRR